MEEIEKLKKEIEELTDITDSCCKPTMELLLDSEKEIKELVAGIDLTRKLNNIIIEGLTERIEESMLIIDDYLNSSGKENRAEISIKAKELYETYFDKDYKNRNERT